MRKRTSASARNGAAVAVAQEVAKARRRAGLKQTELAAKVGTSQRAITRLESGAHNATIGTLERVAKATGHVLRVRLSKG